MRKIGKFEILSELGQGAMGTVYRARDPVLDRLVALKTVATSLLSKRETFLRFEREARAAARLQHRNIVTIYELGEVEGTLYIAMELLEGMDLAQAMVPHDRLTLSQKVSIAVDACRALDFAHKRGVVHRDVKPANILILLDGTVKIVDFGIARFEDSSVTQTGLILGTPSYIAPEVLLGARVDHRTDIWGMGVVLFEMLAGRLPYQATTIAGLIYKIVHEPPPLLDTTALAIPRQLSPIVSTALAKEPGHRYQEMAQMASELQAALGLGSAAETPLFGPARENALQQDLAAARRFLAGNDPEHALEAARRARALDPGRPEVISLIQRIEDLLADTPTIPHGMPAIVPESAGTPALTSTTSVAAPPAPSAASTMRAAPTPRPTARRLPTDVLRELRARGASVFRELATFGEPPATSTASLYPLRERPLLATSGTDGAVRIWDLQSQTRTAVFRTDLHRRSGHDALATALAFSPDGKLLASGHVDGAIHLWDMDQAEEVPVKLRHDASVGTLGFSPDGQVLATGSLDATLKLWDIPAALGGEARRELHRQPSAVTALAYAEGGSVLVTGHANRILRVLDAASTRLTATLRGPEAVVSLLCVSPDGGLLAAVSQDRAIRLYQLSTRALLGTLTGQRRAATSLSFFEDGKHLVSVALDNAVQLWDLEAKSTLCALWGPTEESFAGVALFGAGDHIAVALADGRIRLWGPVN